MIGTVSATVAGVPALFTLNDDRIWEVEHGGIPDELLSAIMTQLYAVVDSYGGPADGPFGPRQIAEAAEFLGGTPYLEPQAPPSNGVVH